MTSEQTLKRRPNFVDGAARVLLPEPIKVAGLLASYLVDTRLHGGLYLALELALIKIDADLHDFVDCILALRVGDGPEAEANRSVDIT